MRAAWLPLYNCRPSGDENLPSSHGRQSCLASNSNCRQRYSPQMLPKYLWGIERLGVTPTFGQRQKRTQRGVSTAGPIATVFATARFNHRFPFKMQGYDSAGDPSTVSLQCHVKDVTSAYSQAGYAFHGFPAKTELCREVRFNATKCNKMRQILQPALQPLSQSSPCP